MGKAPGVSKVGMSTGGALDPKGAGSWLPKAGVEEEEERGGEKSKKVGAGRAWKALENEVVMLFLAPVDAFHTYLRNQGEPGQWKQCKALPFLTESGSTCE